METLILKILGRVCVEIISYGEVIISRGSGEYGEEENMHRNLAKEMAENGLLRK